MTTSFRVQTVIKSRYDCDHFLPYGLADLDLRVLLEANWSATDDLEVQIECSRGADQDIF